MPVDGLFVCGGPVSDGDGTLLSLRHCFLKSPEISRLRVALAENVFRRLTQFSRLHDLLAVERHIAYLTRTILLFSESPGSIAELGAFSVLRECARKLCVVLDQPHATPGSFIYDGPVAHMCRIAEDVPGDSRQVQVFNWPKVPRCVHSPSCGDTVVNLGSDECQGLISELHKQLIEGMRQPPKPATHRLFGSADNLVPHLALLVVDLIRIARCASRADITWMLQTAGKPIAGPGSKAELDYLLTLVETLGFVSAYHLGKAFYCVRSQTPAISYGYKAGTKICSFDPCMQTTWEHIRSSPEASTHKKAYTQHCTVTPERTRA